MSNLYYKSTYTLGNSPFPLADIIKMGRLTGRHGMNWFMESMRGVSGVFVPQATIQDSSIADFKIGDLCTAVVVENDFGSCKWKAIQIVKKTTSQLPSTPTSRQEKCSKSKSSANAMAIQLLVQSKSISLPTFPMAYALYSKPFLLQTLLGGIYDQRCITNCTTIEIKMPLQEVLRKLAKFKPGASVQNDEITQSFLTSLFNLRNMGESSAFEFKLTGPWQLMEIALGKITELNSSIIHEKVLLDMSIHPQEFRYAVARLVQLSLKDLRKTFPEVSGSDSDGGDDADDSAGGTEPGFLIRQQYPLYNPARDDRALVLEIIARDCSTIQSVAAKLRAIFDSTKCLRAALSESSAAALDSKLQKASQGPFLNQFHQSTRCCLTFDRAQRAAFLAGREENLAPAEAELAAQTGPEGALRRTATIPVTDPRKRAVVLAKAGRVPVPPDCRALLRADGSAVDL
jgi:hypothetical protein